MKQIKLNMDRGAVADFLEWLALDDYWGHTLTYWDLHHGGEEVEFIINGHRLSNFSNQKGQVVIDGCYAYVQNFGCTVVNNVKMTNLDYCLMKLGF